jgi:lipoyl(octanoyl) transferase
MGVRLSRWVTMHGFAFNLNPNMTYFDGMIPCGIFEYGVTSLQELDIHFSSIDIQTEIMNLFNNYLSKNTNEV